MSSKVDIFSQALVLLGESPISSFSEGVPGVVASSIYDTTRDSMLTSHRWRFAIGKKALSKLVDTPLNEWRFAFQIPTDLLLPIRVYETQRYEIYEDKLYTNANTVQLDYIYRPDESAFPQYFVEALAARLAEVCAVPITNNLSLQQAMEALASRRLAEATFKDSQGRPPRAIVSRPFLDVRS